MANKQQTAITFLIEQIDKLEEEDGYLDIDKFYWLKQDAIQMEREQIEQAFIKGNEFVPKWKINGVPYIESEQYYEQTYGTTKSS
jgi:hypothetical protein